MPDSHISDAYLAWKRKDIQITFQNVSQAYFLSNSSPVHAVYFVLFLTKICSISLELFRDREHLGNLEHLLPYQDRNTVLHSVAPERNRGFQLFSRNKTIVSRWSPSSPTWRSRGQRRFRSLCVRDRASSAHLLLPVEDSN